MALRPHLRGLDDWKHLSHASSLCGNCTEVCAVKINLHELLLKNRYDAMQEGYQGRAERIAWRVWRMASLNRWMMNSGNARVKNWVVNRLFKGWSAHRTELQFPARTFNERWRERRRAAAAS